VYELPSPLSETYPTHTHRHRLTEHRAERQTCRRESIQAAMHMACTTGTHSKHHRRGSVTCQASHPAVAQIDSTLTCPSVCQPFECRMCVPHRTAHKRRQDREGDGAAIESRWSARHNAHDAIHTHDTARESVLPCFLYTRICTPKNTVICTQVHQPPSETDRRSQPDQ